MTRHAHQPGSTRRHATNPPARDHGPRRSPHHTACLALALALLAPASTAQQVLTVDDDAPADFATIQAAVDASGPADLVLVRDGSYAAFGVSGRSASVVADAGASVRVDGTVQVVGLAADQRVLLHGLQIEDGFRPLWILGCLGPVWVQEGSITVDPTPAYGSGTAAYVELSESVTFTHVSFDSTYAITTDGALFVDSSTVRLYDCLVDGGGTSYNHDGQPGAKVVDGTLFASGSILRGARGGDGAVITVPVGSADGGDGGPGLLVESGLARLLDTTLEGGVGGPSAGLGGVDGASGPASVIDPGATLITLTGDARVYTADAVLREGDTTTLTLHGHAAEFAWLLIGFGDLPAMLPAPTWKGVFVPGLPWFPAFLGSVPAGGVLTGPVTVGTLPVGLEGLRLDTQAVMGGAGDWTLGTPRMLWLLDAGL